MTFTIFYQVETEIYSLDYTADDWSQAYSRARECVPERATTLGIIETRNSTAEKTKKGNFKIKIKPWVVYCQTD